MEEKKYQGIDTPVFESYIEEPDPDLDPDDRVVRESDEERYTPEAILRRALALEEATGHMELPEYQARFYNQARKMLRPLYPDWKPCKKDYRRIRKKMFDARARCRIDLYDQGCALRDAASTAAEYQYAATVFDRLAELEQKRTLNPKLTDPELFEEAEKRTDFVEQAEGCRMRALRLERKKSTRHLVLAGAAALAIVLLYFFSRTAVFLNLKGDAEMALGMYDKAWQAYDVSRQKSGSEEVYGKYKDARYRAADKLKAAGKTGTAKDYYQALAAKDYLDSAAQFAALEQQYLADKDPGKEITFGRAQWLVLDRQDDRILLLRRDSYADMAAQEEGGPVTWEDSSIRVWLNGDYLKEKFYPEEVELLLDTEVSTEPNSISGRSGGDTVTDKVFLLSAREAETYFEYYRKTENCWWLRSPGVADDALAFINVNKDIMEYGYDASSTEIRVKPAIWVKLDPADTAAADAAPADAAE